MSPHGTISRYTNHGCRCDECRAAMTEYMRQYTARKAAGQPVRKYAKHGVRARYNAGCRCARCTEANRIYNRKIDRRLPANRNNRGHGEPMVPLAPLLERIASAHGPGLTDRTIAELCGVSPRTVLRWRRTQQICAGDTDRVAIALGWHPAAIWGITWYIETAEEELAA